MADDYYSLNEFQHDSVRTADYLGRGACAGVLECVLNLAWTANFASYNLSRAMQEEGFLFSEDLTVPRDAANPAEDPWAFSKWLEPERRDFIGKDLGTALYWIAMLADELGFKLSDIALQEATRRKELVR